MIVCLTPPQMNVFCGLLGTPDAPVSKIAPVKGGLISEFFFSLWLKSPKKGAKSSLCCIVLRIVFGTFIGIFESKWKNFLRLSHLYEKTMLPNLVKNRIWILEILFKFLIGPRIRKYFGCMKISIRFQKMFCPIVWRVFTLKTWEKRFPWVFRLMIQTRI